LALPRYRGREAGLYSLYSQALGHLFVEEALAGDVGLDPFSIDYELWDGALAGAFHDFIGGSGRGLDVDVGVGQLVLVEEALGLAAVRAPGAE
jgi:hypothetical protein